MAEMATSSKVGLTIKVKDRDICSFDDLIGTRFVTLEDIRRATSPADSGITPPDDSTVIERAATAPPGSNDSEGITSGAGMVELELRDGKGRSCAQSRGRITLHIKWEGVAIPPPVEANSVGGAVATFLERIPDRKEDEHRFIALGERNARLDQVFGDTKPAHDSTSNDSQ
jgi:hypothetical protein